MNYFLSQIQPGGNCSDFEGYSCVTNNLCRDGIIVTDGSGVLTVKQANPYLVNIQPHLSKCPGDLEVCCLRDEGFGKHRFRIKHSFHPDDLCINTETTTTIGWLVKSSQL